MKSIEKPIKFRMDKQNNNLQNIAGCYRCILVKNDTIVPQTPKIKIKNSVLFWNILCLIGLYSLIFINVMIFIPVMVFSSACSGAMLIEQSAEEDSIKYFYTKHLWVWGTVTFWIVLLVKYVNKLVKKFNNWMDK